MGQGERGLGDEGTPAGIGVVASMAGGMPKHRWVGSACSSKPRTAYVRMVTK